jgi:hypothetical protein
MSNTNTVTPRDMIVIKFSQGLDSSITIEETYNKKRNPIRAIKNCDTNWTQLKEINKTIPVLVETDYGFMGSDLHLVPLAESIPYVHRFVSKSKAVQMFNDLQKIKKLAAKAVGYSI